MKNYLNPLLVLIFLFSYSDTISAQDLYDDIGKISLSVYIPEDDNLSNSNQFLKERIELKNEVIRKLKSEQPSDKKIYWRKNDAYINVSGKELRKVLNINELIRLRSEGYY